jgi:hypothetical protein
MKKINLFLLLVISIIMLSCSKDEATPVQTETLPQTTNPNITNKVKFVISSNESLSEVHVSIRNINIATPLNTIHYYGLKDLSLDITEGNKIVVTMADNNPIQCQYTMYNKNGTIQWQEVTQGVLTATLEKQYIIQ